MAGLIAKEDIERVRERINLEDIVSQYVTLRSAGVDSLKGLCPFHDEKTPSFHVRPAVGRWHCFGCGENGDVFSFIQQIDHLSFTEAVEYLAQKANVTLHYERGSKREAAQFGKRQRLIDAHRIAEEFFQKNLAAPTAQAARDFLGARGFSETTAQHFGIGYAPQSWNELTDLLRSRSFREDEILTAGLASQGRRGLYDRFRGRLIWPIRDLTGATIGFGARRLTDDDQGPKYLNTPETPIYKKSQVLYGLDLAKRNIAKKRRVVIVEGYTDVMAAHIAGIDTAVATCGTAFGHEHVKIIRRLLGDSADPAAGVRLASGRSRGGEVIFTFDGDEAGRKAALKAFAEDQNFASQTFVAVENTGLDPCDLRLERGDDALVKLIESRKPLFEFAIRSSLKNLDLNTAEGRVRGLRETAPIINQIRDHALRREYSRELAGWLGMDERDVSQAIRHSNRATSREQNQRAELPLRASTDPVERSQRQALEAVLQRPADVMGIGFDDLDGDTFATPALRSVHDAIRAAGGLHAFADELQIAQAQEADADQALAVASSRWLNTITDDTDPTVSNVISALLVAPLPQDDPTRIREYAQGVVKSLVQHGFIREIGKCKAQLARLDPESDEHAQVFRRLVTLEEQRKNIR
ncbi:DNA primase [Gleimia hominis]|uniref:DNA primase n=1 Tax=Gleimia hominis TaxID=595468 RepID=A0ABU3IC41_9ACTO|nr:DNA primase [Gleimia hominis]MDT3767496.1 DNA primase [Gleimia hominis]